LKKLVRVKTRQPMILMETPCTAFDNICMDIRDENVRVRVQWTLSTEIRTRTFSLYIYTRPPNQIFTRAVEIVSAFVDHFICIYSAPKALLTDQGSNFLITLCVL